MDFANLVKCQKNIMNQFSLLYTDLQQNPACVYTPLQQFPPSLPLHQFVYPSYISLCTTLPPIHSQTHHDQEYVYLVIMAFTWEV